MKKLYFTILIILSVSILKAQPWAQPGAHWYYQDGDNVQIGFSGYIEITKTGDTLINGTLCDILTCHHVGITWWNGGQPYDNYLSNQYTYISNDTVYNWRNNQFYTLYVFSAQPSDYWITGPGYYGNNCQGDTIRIEDAQMVNVNGINIRRLVPRPYDSIPFPQNPPTIYLHDTIYERFGCLAFLFPIEACITDIAIPLLRCYSDSSGFSFTTNIAPSCDFIITGINENNIHINANISPNPFTSSISITLQNQNIKQATISIKNILGQTVFLKEMKTPKKEIKVDLSFLERGIYLVEVNADGERMVRKIVKE